MVRAASKSPLVGVVVVTHENAAEALVAGARGVLGAQVPALAAVPVAMGEPQATIIAKLSRACDEVDQGAGVLLLVDLHGSSPFNAAMTMLDGTRRAEVLCGVNLAMLIKMSTVDRTETPPVALAEILQDIGRRSIRLGSELTGKVSLEERHR